jgi:D-alanine-D-alanine ligase
MMAKTRVAVLFGGRSPEHDVSIVTGLQALNAIDQAKYEPFPIYIATDGAWLAGDALRNRAAYLPDEATRQALTRVDLDLSAGRGLLAPRFKPGLFAKKPEPIAFDVALLAFHGSIGEDGQLQGVFETANIPYTGMRTLASAVLMDKAMTKRVIAGRGVGLLPDAVIARPATGLVPDKAGLSKALEGLSLPVIVKPAHLGSSIGVAKAGDLDTVRTVLPAIFKFDTTAIIEPFVDNLVEYNVAVTRIGGEVRTSAIERPKRATELLDFKTKYLSGGGAKKSGGKEPGTVSQGMLSLTRDINPEISAELEHKIRSWATEAFLAVGGTGAPRIDFLSDEKTGEVWLNEVNPCPGSFGYFLWEAAEKPVLFTSLLDHLLEEAKAQHRAVQLPTDPTPPDARLFRRR